MGMELRQTCRTLQIRKGKNMKKFVLLCLCAVIVFAFSSCKTNNDGSYKEVDDYKKASSDGYTIKYDDNILEFVKTDDFDYFILKSSIEEDPTDHSITIAKIDNENAENYAKEVEKLYSEGDTSVDESTVSITDSQIFDNAKCVSALALNGEEVYESQLVEDGEDIFWIEYHFSTSLDSVAVENAIYATVSSFKLK